MREQGPVQNPPRGAAGDDYRVRATVCPYCPVGCGYQVHQWTGGRGTGAPAEDTKALWVSPSMTGPVRSDGRTWVTAVTPDPACPVNRGNHSTRGGSLGLGLTFEPDGEAATRERFRTPMIRLRSAEDADATGRDEWASLAVDEALDLVADLIRLATSVPDGQGGERPLGDPSRVGVRLSDGLSLEASYAATSLFYGKLKTPNVAFHDRPSVADGAGVLGDAGIYPYAPCYDDLSDCDVILLLGSNPYETQSALFQQAMAGRHLVVLDPRETITADYAKRTGGCHLRPPGPGMDARVINALSRRVLEIHRAERPAETAALERLCSQDRISAFSGTPDLPLSMCRAVGAHCTLEKLRVELAHEDFALATVAQDTGIAASDLEAVARLLARGEQRCAILFEKGLLWGFNYQNLAAVANLAILTFNFNAPNREGDPAPSYADLLGGVWKDRKMGFCGRLGGRQKAWAEAAPYPLDASVDFCVRGDGERFPIPSYFDHHLVGTDPNGGRWTTEPRVELESRDGRSTSEEISLLWVVGCNPAGQMQDAAFKWERIRERQWRGVPPQRTDKEDAKEALRQRARDRWPDRPLIVIQQDLYPNYTTQFADLVLPVRGWGEERLTRSNGERRLRLYDRFQDAPGDATGDPLPADWAVFARVGAGLYADGSFDWSTAAEVFEDVAERGVVDLGESLRGVQAWAPANDRTGYGALADRGTRGLQWPLRQGKDGPSETSTRHHDDVPGSWKHGEFGPFFLKIRWEEIRERAADLATLGAGELWICSGRVNEAYGGLYAGIRNRWLRDRLPDDLPGTLLEINQQTADDRGLWNGAVVKVRHPQADPASNRAFTAVVSVQESVPSHMAFALMAYPVSTPRDVAERKDHDCFYRRFRGDGYVNNITGAYVDPSNPVDGFKYARGVVEATGGGHRLPTHAPRHRAFPAGADPYGPIDARDARTCWKARETIVASSLSRINVLQRRDSGAVIGFGSHGPFWRTTHARLEDFKMEPVLNQYPLIDPVEPSRSFLVAFLRGGRGTPRMPTHSIPLPEAYIQRIERWIREGCRAEGFADVQHLLDHAVRPHARLTVPIGHPQARDDFEKQYGVPLETVMRDPAWGVQHLRGRRDLLRYFHPETGMRWRDGSGRILASLSATEYEIMKRLMQLPPPPPRAAVGPPVTFERVRGLLDEIYPTRAMHGDFWCYLDRDEFVSHRVPYSGGELAIIRKGDGAGSPLVQSLRGVGPFENFKMPLGPDLGEPTDIINEIELWIDHGCP